MHSGQGLVLTVAMALVTHGVVVATPIVAAVVAELASFRYTVIVFVSTVVTPMAFTMMFVTMLIATVLITWCLMAMTTVMHFLAVMAVLVVISQ